MQVQYRKRLSWPLMFEKGEAGECRPDDGAAFNDLHFDETAIVGVFPHWQPRAGCAPGVHHFLVSPLPYGYPFDEVQDQVFDWVAHVVQDNGLGPRRSNDGLGLAPGGNAIVVS